ncbi:mismatch-specific DNA-glycosylase [Kocuria koreensis]|jgi:TDG/mug DNA glycosylase family protein|uniref:Mismatch-specific DNA-glycosylase n=1 Tax=Rothia koreensis TaxID=592378 RepID=A0A7K1LFS3_9MICC|nr:mismatch-specific DNA-glycosylase [Rothia koreensis]
MSPNLPDRLANRERPSSNAWEPWRAASPLDGRRPSKEELRDAIESGLGREDVLPWPRDEQNSGWIRLLIVGINPSPWTAAVNAPFARPGNRFWPSLEEAGILPRRVDASRGLSREDERMMVDRGIGITNVVPRPSARADELSAEELIDGGAELVTRVSTIGPRAVAVVGITAYRQAFSMPKAVMGRQEAGVAPPGWPDDVELWVLPNPSGLNAHETVGSLAEKWRAVWESSAPTGPTQARPRADT